MRKIELEFDNSDIAKLRYNILRSLSAQLSDGYWENDEGFQEEFWNWLEFRSNKNKLIISIKNRPTWKGVKDIFSNKSDKEVIKYIAETLKYCYEEAPEGVIHSEDEEIEIFINELSKYYNIGD